MRNLKNLDVETLMDLPSVASYNSDWLSCTTLESERHLDDHEYSCREERWATRLVKGGHLVCFDVSDDEAQEHRLTLEDFKTGVEKCYEQIIGDVADFNNEHDDYDTCSNIMQVIVFGEVIYG